MKRVEYSPHSRCLVIELLLSTLIAFNFIEQKISKINPLFGLWCLRSLRYANIQIIFGNTSVLYPNFVNLQSIIELCDQSFYIDGDIQKFCGLDAKIGTPNVMPSETIFHMWLFRQGGLSNLTFALLSDTDDLGWRFTEIRQGLSHKDNY